jgi:hypothetical protein
VDLGAHDQVRAMAHHHVSAGLHRLTTLSIEDAEALAQVKGLLGLTGLVTLSPEVAEALAKHAKELEVTARLRVDRTAQREEKAARLAEEG